MCNSWSTATCLKTIGCWMYTNINKILTTTHRAYIVLKNGEYFLRRVLSSKLSCIHVFTFSSSQTEACQVSGVASEQRESKDENRAFSGCVHHLAKSVHYPLKIRRGASQRTVIAAAHRPFPLVISPPSRGDNIGCSPFSQHRDFSDLSSQRHSPDTQVWKATQKEQTTTKK